MVYVGIDLHKKTISACVVDQERTVLSRKQLLCADTLGIAKWFRSLGPCQFAVEATTAYDWLVRILEPLSVSWVLVHPGKFRVIAESLQKSDRHDAQKLAEFLALGLLPKAYAPTPRQREHRQWVRFRAECQRRVSRVKCQLRHLAATYNADHAGLFGKGVLAAFALRPELSGADRFILAERRKELGEATKRTKSAKARLRKFGESGSETETKLRSVLVSIPGIGEIVSEVILAELADGSRFRSLKDVSAYAGLVPKKHESDGTGKQLGITKAGSRLLRWAMVEAAWVAVQTSSKWRERYERIKKTRQSKRAIVAIARKLLVTAASMMRKKEEYQWRNEGLADWELQKERRAKRREARKAAKESATPTGVANVETKVEVKPVNGKPTNGKPVLEKPAHGKPVTSLKPVTTKSKTTVKRPTPATAV